MLGVVVSQLTHLGVVAHSMLGSRAGSSGHLMICFNKQEHVYSFKYHTIPNFYQFVKYELYYLCYSLWYLNLIRS